ncbi:Agmatine coumaroyltransferase-2 [Ananas comosus]|uniref:Agmatine coumaroyltransferase-2 n=1 Tax=Ananas comosus TaxID=4615 RepID=A0A199UNF8_ANACO|nr:Agmatine coumaroyltransferase-2 [Ananas comosus]
MKVRVESSKLVKPFYGSGGADDRRTAEFVPLTVFDRVAEDAHFSAIFAYRPPTPPNSAFEKSLAAVLAVYREWAGRFGVDGDGNPVIVLNDEGVRFIEASVDSAHDEVVPREPSPAWLNLHPSKEEEIQELLQIQLTRFACGTLTVGHNAHHRVADGQGAFQFFAAWARACRAVSDDDPAPALPAAPHDRAALFAPRRPPRCEFDHRRAEFCRKNTNPAVQTLDGASVGGNVVVHRAHFSKQFICQLKAAAAGTGGDDRLRYSTFVCVMAQLWRAITRSRRVGGAASTHLRINVNGRARLVPPAPDDYSGNLILWAFPRATAEELVRRPVSYAAGLIERAVAGLDDRYFRSFIDFASTGAVEEEGLVPLVESNLVALSPHVDVYSWNRFPLKAMDFGGGGGNGNGGEPFYVVPSYFAMEGVVIIAPSFAEEGAIDAYVSLFEDNLASFVEECECAGEVVHPQNGGVFCNNKMDRVNDNAGDAQLLSGSSALSL